MSTEQSTIVVYELTGSTRRFHVPFEYLSRQFVVVTVLGAGRTTLTLGSDYRFISLNEIETTVAYGGPDGNFLIEIRRVTSASDRLVEFADGSVLRSRDMNVSAIQTIHIAEEARNLAADTLASDDDGNLDARGRRLVNLGNAVNPKDAVTFDQVMEWSQSALNQANRSQTEANNSAASAAAALASQNAAAASQSAAKTSETNAKTSETNAKTSETNAKTSETAAKSSETAAKSSETIARQQAQSATTKAGESALSASNALSSEGLAREWAENPVDVPVVEGKFSAKHWAQQAKGFAGGDNYLQVQYNLSDIPDKTLAISNLGLQPWAHAATASAALDALDFSESGKAVATGTPEQGREGLKLGDAATRNADGSKIGNLVPQGGYGIRRGVSGRDADTFQSYWNDINLWGPSQIWTNSNNALSLHVSSLENQRTASLQSGHALPEYKNTYGPLRLNPFGGEVTVNGYRILSGLNTTIDSNGFIKNASPIIKLYADRIESNSEEQFGATPIFARKSKGVYEITGTLGLRSEGWFLDTPNDRNGNKYFNVEWTQNITPTAVAGIVDEYRDDIVVTIETFERVWNKETGMFDNGSPIDINELQDRFVQLRFNEIKVEHEE